MALIAQVIVAKFGDHLPFYRQADIYARHGIRLDRATLGNWAGRACFHLQPIASHTCRAFLAHTTHRGLDRPTCIPSCSSAAIAGRLPTVPPPEEPCACPAR